MSFDDTINAYFVTTGTVEESNKLKCKDLELAFSHLRKHISEDNIRHIKASEGFPLVASGQLTKKDVFIFDHFDGDFFDQLQLTKSLLIGPRCLISCLLSGLQIPLGTSPIYTTAMRDLHISATGIAADQKEQVRKYIQWMGGYYFQNLGRQVTHLISNTIKSTKYEHATLNGIPVMHVDWVQRVWERSCVDNVAAADAEFDKYKLPIFFGTNITCTGLETEKKNEIMRLVNDNGGTYHCAFRSALVDIVITERGNTNSDKYKAAVRYKKEILCPEWIFDSAEKGFALPTKGYQVKSLKVSTPIKGDRSIADFTQLSDTSRISVMGAVGRSGRSDLTTVNDTISSGLNETAAQPQNDGTFVAPIARPSTSKDLQRDIHRKQGAAEFYRIVYDEICPKQAKKAGNFLDGCCIYLSGFRLEEREKLNRILNVGGATRYDVVNEKITHIIVGQLDDAELRSWKRDGILTSVNIVRLDWLLQSIKLKQPASEVVYRMALPTTREPDVPSPSSKKTLRSMNHSFKQPDKPKKKLFESEEKSAEKPPTPIDLPLEVEEQNLIAQYSQENEPAATVPIPNPVSNNILNDQTSEPMASSTMKPLASNEPLPPPENTSTHNENSTKMNTEIDFENLDFFKGMNLYIDREHFPEEFYSQMLSECEAAHGKLVPSTCTDVVDYAIVSFERTLNVRELPIKARHIVTDLYVENCMKQNKLVPIEYFHRHVPYTANSQPLVGMTIVISLYTALEYDFIDSVAQLLGAAVNRVLAKKERPLLICPRAEGSKYEGAIKWGYPIVTSAWLVQCAVEGKKLPYKQYLVGNSPTDFPVSPTLREINLPNATTRASSNAVTPITTAGVAIEPMDTQDNTENDHGSQAAPTATDFTPLRNKRVTELAGSFTRNTRPTNSTVPTTVTPITPESPHTPTNAYGRSSCNFEYLESVVDELDNEDARACLRDLIEEMRNNQTPELERIRRQACTPINHKLPTPKGIPDFCTTPEFQKRMADALERRWRLPTKKLKVDTPIDELRRRVLRSTCEALGIPFYDTDETPTTSAKAAKKALAATAEMSALAALNTNTPLNSFTQTKSPKETKNISRTHVPRAIFPETQNASVNISERRTTRVSDGDAFVPSTQTPTSRGGGSLGGEVSRMVPQASFGKTTLDFDKISFENTEADTVRNGTAAHIDRTDTQSSTRSPSALATSSPELQKITEYLKNCESRRQSLKQSRRAMGIGNASGTCVSDNAETMANDMDTDVPACGAADTDTQNYVQPFESEQFGVGTENMVGWRDPVEFDKERRSKASCSMQYKGIPRFSISCVDEETRNDVISKIHKLGGTVSENLVNFDPECTHFICERPNRGEKMLGCVSAGKWVLSLKYIEECYAKDVFVDEELYEWGNSKALNLPQLTTDEQILAQAAHRWRKKLLKSSSANGVMMGAFSGFRVILHIAERNAEAVTNVLRAGHGEVLAVQTPFSACSAVKNATHCFVDMKKAPLTRIDYDYLRSLGTQIYSQMYINSYLMYGEDVDAAKYEVKIQ